MDLYSNELSPQMGVTALSGLPLVGLLSNLLGARSPSASGGATPAQGASPITPSGGGIAPPPGVSPQVVNQTGGSPATSAPTAPPLPQAPALPGAVARLPDNPLMPQAPILGSTGPANLGEAYPGLGWQQARGQGAEGGQPRQGIPGQTTPAFQQPSSGVPAIGGPNAPGGASTQSSQAPALAGGYGNGPGQILVPQQWQQTMQDTDSKYSLPPGQMGRTARIESAFNPLAKNGNAEGLMQFEPGTAKQWRLKDPMDPIASIDAAGQYAQASMKGITAAMGRPATGPEIYMAHQQGLGGALALIKNPDMNAVEALKTLPMYQKNPAKALAAITKNGGSASGTAGDFLDLWANKFNTGKVPGPTGGPAAAGPAGPGGEAGASGPGYADGVHPALAAAHASGDPLLTMALLQAVAPYHKFEPVGYDPFKEAPPPQPWQNVPLGG